MVSRNIKTKYGVSILLFAPCAIFCRQPAFAPCSAVDSTPLSETRVVGRPSKACGTCDGCKRRASCLHPMPMQRADSMPPDPAPRAAAQFSTYMVNRVPQLQQQNADLQWIRRILRGVCKRTGHPFPWHSVEGEADTLALQKLHTPHFSCIT